MIMSCVQYCYDHGGYLAEITTREEEEILDIILQSDVAYWIGLTDYAVEGQWTWQNSHQRPEYTNWARGLESEK